MWLNKTFLEIDFHLKFKQYQKICGMRFELWCVHFKSNLSIVYSEVMISVLCYYFHLQPKVYHIFDYDFHYSADFYVCPAWSAGFHFLTLNVFPIMVHITKLVKNRPSRFLSRGFQSVNYTTIFWPIKLKKSPPSVGNRRKNLRIIPTSKYVVAFS